MTQKDKSSDTWISLSERPPPERQVKPGLLLLLRSKFDGKTHLGYYLGNGNLRIWGPQMGRQLPLKLDEIDAWMAIDPEQLQEIENAELETHAAG